MGNEEHGAPVIPYESLQPGKGLLVQVVPRLVHEQDVRFPQQGPGNGNLLALPSGEHLLIVGNLPLRQFLQAHPADRLPDFLLPRVQPAQPDIFPYGALEQIGRLLHIGALFPPAVHGNLPQLHPIDPYPAPVSGIQPAQKLDQGGLPAAVPAADRRPGPDPHLMPQARKHLFFPVGEPCPLKGQALHPPDVRSLHILRIRIEQGNPLHQVPAQRNVLYDLHRIIHGCIEDIVIAAHGHDGPHGQAAEGYRHRAADQKEQEAYRVHLRRDLIHSGLAGRLRGEDPLPVIPHGPLQPFQEPALQPVQAYLHRFLHHLAFQIAYPRLAFPLLQVISFQVLPHGQGQEQLDEADPEDHCGKPPQRPNGPIQETGCHKGQGNPPRHQVHPGNPKLCLVILQAVLGLAPPDASRSLIGLSQEPLQNAAAMPQRGLEHGHLPQHGEQQRQDDRQANAHQYPPQIGHPLFHAASQRVIRESSQHSGGISLQHLPRHRFGGVEQHGNPIHRQAVPAYSSKVFFIITLLIHGTTVLPAA